MLYTYYENQVSEQRRNEDSGGKSMAILKLAPSFKDYIWGGRRLIEEYHKPYDGDILAESWKYPVIRTVRLL